MPEETGTASGIAELVRIALNSGDLESLSHLLDRDVHWGPGPSQNDSDCKNRSQVLDWWSTSRERGASATVTEIVPSADRLLVGLRVLGAPGADEQGGGTERWQVLTVRDGLVTDIRGFEERSAAAAQAGVA